MSVTDLPLAFVDIETTGSHFEHDRITEVAVLTLSSDGVCGYEKLINPESPIPTFIQTLTGITPEMVMDQQPFEEEAKRLFEQLEGKLFVAHNARFDYGFLKAAFKRVGLDFKPKVICTVKLSRYLFPEQKRHNLDTLIQVHDLQVSQRHRAMGDAHLLYQFWTKCLAQFGQAKMNEALQSQLGHASLPPHIDSERIDQIPETPGVYLFYADNELPLYIGKSKHLRTRVLSHFQSALGKRKEMKLSLQVKRIEWIETQGELGALLLESRMIKKLLPQMNIKLRRSKALCSWVLSEDEKGYLRPKLISANVMKAGEQEAMYGLFPSQRAATLALSAIAKKSLLCEGVLGLVKLTQGSACFAHQVKLCAGACIGLESPLKHNLRLTTALTRLRLSVWPYKGPIGIKEGDEMHVVDQWCYLGTTKHEGDVHDLLQNGQSEFDMDTYQLLKKSLKTFPPQDIVQLSSLSPKAVDLQEA